MKVIIAGGRDFSNYALLVATMHNFYAGHSDVEAMEIVSGTARGADQLGERYAKDFNFECTHFPADWDTFGKSAGYRRNADMANYADALVAFWDGKSRGTHHMIDLAGKKGLEVVVIKYGEKDTQQSCEVGSNLNSLANRGDNTMALQDNSTNSGNGQRKADAFLNLSFVDASGKTHYLQATEYLYEDKLVGRSLINAAKADPNFVLKIEGRVNIPDPNAADIQF